MTRETWGRLIRFAAWFAASGNLRLQAAALRFLREAQRSPAPGSPPDGQIAAAARSAAGGSLPLLFLRYKVLQRAGEDVSDYQAALYEQDVTSEIFLDNLKSATPWIIKVVGIELLQDQVEHGLREHMLHIATHFSNLVKVSERVGVRHAAGEALVRLIPLLRREQRNEVVVELGKGLEMGQYQISIYPGVSGPGCPAPPPQRAGRAGAVAEEPAGLPHQHRRVRGAEYRWGAAPALPAYRGRFPEPERAYEARRQELLGLLLQGLAHYREEVRQEALLVTRTMLFDSPVLSMEEKSRLFSLCYRKLLFLIQAGPRQDPLTFFYRASALAHINRFIALRRLDKGPSPSPSPGRSPFPRHLDPFTLSHKGIAHAIREMGFEVYLAVDEFSWSKKPQPHMIRRQIVNLSIAGDFHIHLFPNDIPVNLSNPRDLRRLRSSSPARRSIWWWAAMWWATPAPIRPPLWTGRSTPWTTSSSAGRASPPAGGKGAGHHRKSDPAPAAPPPGGHQLYPYPGERGHEPGHLHLHRPGDPGLHLSERPVPPRHPGQAPCSTPGTCPSSGWSGRTPCWWPMSLLGTGAGEPADRYPPGRGPAAGAAPPSGGAGSPCWVGSASAICPQPTSTPRFKTPIWRTRCACGREVKLCSSPAWPPKRSRRRTMPSCWSVRCSPTPWRRSASTLSSTPTRGCAPETEELFRRQGFIRRDGGPLEADLRAPVVLLQNLETTIQEPLSRNPRVLAAIRRGHQRLQTALTGLYPGNLVLTLSADVIHHRLLRMITQFNQVPQEPTTPPEAGEIYVRPLR